MPGVVSALIFALSFVVAATPASSNRAASAYEPIARPGLESTAWQQTQPAFVPGSTSGGAGATVPRTGPNVRFNWAMCDWFWCACVESPGSECYQNYCFTNCEERPIY